MTQLLRDTFTRADSAVTLGSAETGGAYSALGGTWGISSNKAYVAVEAASLNLAVLDAGQKNGKVQADITLPSAVRAWDGLALRVVDASNFLNIILYRNTANSRDLSYLSFNAYIAGVETALVTNQQTLTLSSTYELAVECIDDRFLVYLDDELMIDYTLPSSGYTQFLTPTKFGLFHETSAQTSVRWDNFTFDTIRPRDYVNADLYINDQPYVLAQGEMSNQAVPVEPPRQDTGQNPNEVRLESGLVFSQNDFSHGAGQLKYHGAANIEADPLKFFWCDVADISQPGKLQMPKNYASQAVAVTNFAQAGSTLFWGQGTSVGKTTDLSAFSTEDPHAGEGAQTVQMVASEGARVFAAITTNGVHIRSSAGVWSHWQPDGAINLNIANPTKLLWARERLFVAGGTSGRSIYEVVASSTPTAMLTLKEGWSWSDIFDGGNRYIYGIAINEAAGLSEVHAFTLNGSGTAFIPITSTRLPINEIAKCGLGYLGLVFLGGGRKNSGGGLEAFLYMAQPTAEGNLALQLIAQAQKPETQVADRSVLSLTATRDSVLFNWRETDPIDGLLRYRIGSYNIARGAFNPSAFPMTFTPVGPKAITYFKGRLCAGQTTALIYEHATDYLGPTGTLDTFLWTSLADWRNGDLKATRRVDFTCRPLLAGEQISVYYTNRPWEENVWTLAGAATAGMTGASINIPNVEGRVLGLALKLSRGTDATQTPVLLSFTLVADGFPEHKQFQLARTVQIFSEVTKRDANYPLQYNDPRAEAAAFEDLYLKNVKLFEEDQEWLVRVEGVKVQQVENVNDVAPGTSGENGYFVSLLLKGVKS